jgi:integrase/recombinase XerD
MTKPTTPLRQRMIEDMTIRNMSPLTQAHYVRAVAKFARQYGASPDKLTFEDVRNYQVHLIERGLKTATIIPIMCAIRFLYGTTLGMKEFAEQIPLPRKEDKLPTVLSRDEVMRFLKAVADLRMRTIFITIYAAGLRVSEVIALSAADIDSSAW